jgi:hypothetical protein
LQKFGLNQFVFKTAVGLIEMKFKNW